MKNSSNKKYSIILLLIMFLSYSGANLELYKNYENKYLYSFISSLENIMMNLIFMGIIPFIIRLTNKKFYIINCKKIFIINGTIIMIISAITSASGGFGLLGTIIFSLIIYFLLEADFICKTCQKKVKYVNEYGVCKSCHEEIIKRTNKKIGEKNV